MKHGDREKLTSISIGDDGSIEVFLKWKKNSVNS